MAQTLTIRSQEEVTEKSSCGVGFVASRKGIANHAQLQSALLALRCVEHRGACGADNVSSDGAGVMTDIPFDYFGYEKGSVAIAALFIPSGAESERIALKIFSDTFGFYGLRVQSYRPVPINIDALGKDALKTMPTIKHVVIARPEHCRTDMSFNKLLYAAKQMTRIKTKEAGLNEFFFASLSTNTIVYKALTKADALDKFYLDLQQPGYKTRFALFHRRFSTNTQTSWDKAQPFRLIAHNGEINTIRGNRSWAYAREKSLGLRADELLTHYGISDTGSMNEMVEALLYRSSLPRIEDVLAIMIPPANSDSDFYKFWSRAMEPWDGPAFITYSDGDSVGARLDRNGFRPCRWAMTDEHFYLSSEAGSFGLDESSIISKGTLHAGSGVKIDLETGEIDFNDPSGSRHNYDAYYDPHLIPIETMKLSDLPSTPEKSSLKRKQLFGYTEEDINKILVPMIADGKEPIGSMGDTARPAIFSDEPRSFFDYFYQNFAQVTNPPVDYMRESMVTDLSVYLGVKPNIFSPKEMIPPPLALELKSPVLSLGQMAFLETFKADSPADSRVLAREFDMTFNRSEGIVGFRAKLESSVKEVVRAVTKDTSIIILSDRNANFEHLPIPSLLMLRAVVNALNEAGVRLEASIVVHSGEVRTTHQLAALVGFGATAVCPYLALETARREPHTKLDHLSPDEKESNLIKAFETGLLKVMSKMGISVVQSYQSARLFSAVGIGKKMVQEFFPGLYSPIGGIELENLVDDILRYAAQAETLGEKLFSTYQYKEHNQGARGEKHSMTNARSKLIHKLAREKHLSLDAPKLYDEYLKLGDVASPVNVRHLFELKPAASSLSLDDVQSRESILKTFGSGAMSFGAISAEAQRDIFLAMKQIGGRSNSGEGGENPYYYSLGITAHTKQVASARFGVTAEYLISGKELQIKIAQGAKPGEGGQLMSVKVSEDIARARHSLVGIDLISPPPMHDIYSIEDLKELIYELKQVHPDAKVNVKLVSGANIGTIAVGVAKAGADVIHISGCDGGTGAASLSSMKHAGLPWEIGLWEAHKTLIENGLRKFVTLRTDGGLSTGKDIIMAAIFGAEEYDFGKLLLVAQGCVMARICETNACPTGIATHDEKFKAKYKGAPEHIIETLNYIAEDVRRWLSVMGKKSLLDIVGKTDLLDIHPNCLELINRRNLDLSFFVKEAATEHGTEKNPFNEGVSVLNQTIVNAAKDAIETETAIELRCELFSNERAVLATLSGEIARKINAKRIAHGRTLNDIRFNGNIHISFTGSAGQGFGAFLTEGVSVKLFGEANDSVCKSMSGGKVVVRPMLTAKFTPETNVIIGNCALYGATGGTLYVRGLAGDRFAVRNSGATTVVEGVGLHACEYMTNGRVVILGKASHNLGAGMTGGTLYLLNADARVVNKAYLASVELSDIDYNELYLLIADYASETDSTTARALLENWDITKQQFKKFIPIGLSKRWRAVSDPTVQLA